MAAALFDELTSQELRIALLAAQGCSNRQIGEKVHLSVNTIKTYMGRILTKSRTRSRCEAVAQLMLDERFRELFLQPVVDVRDTERRAPKPWPYPLAEVPPLSDHLGALASPENLL